MSGLLNEDGRLERRCEMSPQQVLAKHIAGVYTTALMTSTGAVIDWNLHRRRLERGMDILNTRTSRPFDPLLTALADKGMTLGDFMQQRVAALVRDTCGEFFQDSASSEQHAMVVVGVSPRDTHPDQGPTHAGIGTQPAAWPDEPHTEGSGTVSPPLLPAQVFVYVKSVQPPPFGSEHAVEAAVMGRPRELPGAKANSWVLERRQWEQAKPPEAAEVLLFDEEGCITEGLVTNFCVVAQELGGPPVLHACGTGALPGVVLTRVREAAARLGLRLAEGPPRCGERHLWQEAFITNCIKRVQPLRRVFCPPGNAWGAEPWDCTLPEAAGPHTVALRQLLEELEERTPYQQL